MKIVYANHQHDSLAKELKKQGHEVIVSPCEGHDFELDLDALRNTVESHQPDLVVGVAGGGSLVMELNPPQPVVLLAPTSRRPTKLKKQAVVIHGALDKEVPVEATLSLENALIYMVQDDHWFKGAGLKCFLGVVAEISSSQNVVS